MCFWGDGAIPWAICICVCVNKQAWIQTLIGMESPTKMKVMIAGPELQYNNVMIAEPWWHGLVFVAMLG